MLLKIWKRKDYNLINRQLLERNELALKEIFMKFLKNILSSLTEYFSSLWLFFRMQLCWLIITLMLLPPVSTILIVILILLLIF